MSERFSFLRAKTAFFLVVFLLSACGQKTETPLPEETPSAAPTIAPPTVASNIVESDGAILAIEENGYAHLFIVQPRLLQWTRMTSGEWNDAAPALNADGTRLAFASDRNGFWDLYVTDLQTGATRQITDTPQYDFAPSWSPDGQWLAFETYPNGNLDIAIVNVETGEIVALTQHPAADHSPTWAPDGRNIAFVSTRSGDSDIWLANLDVVGDERYTNLSASPFAAESAPQWTSDGSKLLWTSSSSQPTAFSGIYVWSADDPQRAAYWIGEGERGAWNASANAILAAINTPNETYLALYDLNGSLLQRSAPLSGRTRGMVWGDAQLSQPLPDVFLQAAAETPAALWSPILTPSGDVPNQRFALAPLDGVQAPFPQMHDLTDESFNALRARVAQEAGWDVLASLENAFIPLTTRLEPGMDEDWLYTGRAFAVNSLMANAGWMTILREDIGAQTYWRVYVRCAAQDGSLGEPIHDAPWNLSARYDLDPNAYEQGGGYASVPGGYWINLTDLASAYGWQRQPSLPNWRAYYKGARFSTFVNDGGLTWLQAMRQLYPEEALTTPTKVLLPSLTPTQTPSNTPTPRPTRTPRATFTPRATLTASSTPLPPTATPTPPTVIPED